MSFSSPLVIWFEDLSRDDVPKVGGKNASLGEMVARLSGAGIRVPPGFATSADMFRDFLTANRLNEGMAETLARLDAGKLALAQAGQSIRAAIQAADWPEDARQAILSSYRELARRTGLPEPAVAVRSSATAEDLPDASFAGQQETFLNIRGEAALLDACRRCYASLYTDRAITYRRLKGFEHARVALSVGVQHMVRSDIGGAGVMFTIDTESGFDKVVLINAAWGLGETVVQGTVSPDEYQVFKPLLGQPGLVPILEKKLGAKERKLVHGRGAGSATRDVPTSAAERARLVLSDEEILDLARQACVIERHYGRAMDIEWAKDGDTGLLHIVQARPETVRSGSQGTFLSYRIGQHGRELLRGLSIGEAVAAGTVCLIESVRDIGRFV
ncbi:MAG TPA: PEP/pyruvate-binding domain-containing protein, partial [Paracoccus sp. (in: a-proteobacteria)]|nr:PEP/pyruvate-binding domain-containing protein [Paracoccus sp. (in: a-proteobacteria)]